MEKYKKDGYLGTIASDEIMSLILPKVNRMDDKISFIMNLDDSTKQGSHWVAIYMTPRQIEYFNSFGDAPTKNFIEQIKQVANKLNPNGIFKMKVNHIQRQDVQGYFLKVE